MHINVFNQSTPTQEPNIHMRNYLNTSQSSIEKMHNLFVNY